MQQEIISSTGERFRFCVSKPRSNPEAGVIRIHGKVTGKNYRQARRLIKAVYQDHTIHYIK